MAKYSLGAIVILLAGVIFLMPQASFAAYDAVQFTADTNIYLWGIPLILVVSSGGMVAEMQVDLTSVTFDMENGSAVTITSPDRRVLTNNVGVATECADTFSRITLTSTAIQAITITPGNTCGGGGGGGGGGARVTPAPTTTQEEIKTTVGQATTTATAGGIVQATTSEGATAKLEVPAAALTADAQVTIAPTKTTDVAVLTQVKAMPAGQSIVGGYVYDYSLKSAGKAVTIFEKAVTVTLTYTDKQIAGLNEDGLQIYYYDTSLSKWVPLGTTVDKAQNKAAATTGHFTLFAILGQAQAVAKPVAEMTIEEIKAEIARITALLLQLQAELAQLQGVESIPAEFIFERNLRLGLTGDDAKYLQIVLNSDLDTKVAESGAGSPGKETTYFGPLTKKALIKFQEKYASDILSPWGLTEGTGLVGSTTQAKLNKLLE